jgi:hypothetical protein
MTTIPAEASKDCASFASVTFQSAIPSSGFLYDIHYENRIHFNASPFDGDLREKFYETDKDNGTPGTYTRKKRGKKWTRFTTNSTNKQE